MGAGGTRPTFIDWRRLMPAMDTAIDARNGHIQRNININNKNIVKEKERKKQRGKKRKWAQWTHKRYKL